ncbi:hypothetical protein GCM10028857_00470 [Salinarchaeum chitinilyticum]
MSDIADLSLPDPIFFGPTFETVPNAEFTVEDAHYVQSGPDAVQYVFFCWVRDAPLGDFESAIDGDASLSGWSRLVEFDDRALYRIVTTSRSASTDPLVFPLGRRHDVTVLESRRDADGFHVRVRAPSRDALRAFESDLTDRGATVSVERISPEIRATGESCEITEKQWQALALAFERGYFATPKEVTLTELAEEYGTTRQTLSHHVRSAVEFLVERAINSHAAPSVVEESA